MVGGKNAFNFYPLERVLVKAAEMKEKKEVNTKARKKEDQDGER